MQLQELWGGRRVNDQIRETGRTEDSEKQKGRVVETIVEAKAAGRMTDAIKFRYRHPEIKLQIRSETRDKCAYCESKITHVYAGDTEHIVPSSEVPDLVVEWTNLTLACKECNRRKTDYYNVADPLVNPYVDDPENHLLAAGALIFGKAGDRKGALTELKLELNRGELIERRYERLKSLKNLIERYANQPAGMLKDLLRDELLTEIRDDKEYAFISRVFIKLCCDVSPRRR